MTKLIRIFPIVTCVLLLGCAQDFPRRVYNEDDQGFRDMLATEPDFDSRLALARLYFEHNQLDQADTLLRTLTAEDPENPHALAWYGANNCKLAGRSQPWLMGLLKLYRVYACLDQVEQAAARAPTDLTVQLVLVNTGVAVDMFGSLDSAETALNQLLAGGNEAGDRFPIGPRAHIFLAAAEFHKALGNQDKAKRYLERVIELNADSSTVAMARESL